MSAELATLVVNSCVITQGEAMVVDVKQAIFSTPMGVAVKVCLPVHLSACLCVYLSVDHVL